MGIRAMKVNRSVTRENRLGDEVFPCEVLTQLSETFFNQVGGSIYVLKVVANHSKTQKVLALLNCVLRVQSAFSCLLKDTIKCLDATIRHMTADEFWRS